MGGVGTGVTRKQTKKPLLDDHDFAGRNNVHAVRLDLHAIVYLAYLHACGATQELGHGAFMLGIEMGDEHECHSGLLRQRLEQIGEGFQPAR